MPNPVKQLALKIVPRAAQRRLKKWYYPHLLSSYSEKQWPEAMIVRRLVAPGSHVVDAGANIGYISLLLSKIVGPTGVVHSFEPVPQTFELLANNVRSLGLANVRARQMGVSDAPGKARMSTPDYEGGGENLYESKLVNGVAPGSFEVELTRIDDALGADAERVSFMKMDVEGHELAAIRGSMKLIEAKAALLIEVSGDPDATGSEAASLFALLSANGYAAFRFDGRKLHRRKRGEKAVDYFFLADAHIAKLTEEIAS